MVETCGRHRHRHRSDALDLPFINAESVRACAGFYAMTSFHLLARDRPSIYKPFEVAAFLGFFAW